MTSRLNEASANYVPEAQAVAKPLSDLPKTERRKVTSELLRIHNMVNALEQIADHKDSRKDKADLNTIG
jgi:hypothetical protein